MNLSKRSFFRKEGIEILINKVTVEFSKEFCVNGRIDWKKLVQFNSGNLEVD